VVEDRLLDTECLGGEPVELEDDAADHWRHRRFAAVDGLGDRQSNERVDYVVLAEVDDGEAGQRDVGPPDSAVDRARSRRVTRDGSRSARCKRRVSGTPRPIRLSILTGY
jgi:hypothetical protein